jgi:1,2-diacylglycerol 3-beta-glucosyltransferase
MSLMSLVVWLSNGYFFTMLALGARELRRRGVRMSDAAALRYGDPHRGRTDDLYFYFLIPCLNESAVIGRTVRGLTGHPRARTVVIDDACDDDTATQTRQASAGDTAIVRRELPEARKGKGAALNAGLAAVRRMVQASGQDPAQVIVCVMDADGHLSDGALAHVAREFAAHAAVVSPCTMTAAGRLHSIGTFP